MLADRWSAMTSKVRAVEISWSKTLASALFSTNVWFGRVVGIGLLCSNPKAWLLALLGNLIANLSARIFSQNAFLSRSHPISLNGVYVGVAIAAFVPSLLQSLTLLTLAATIVPSAAVVCGRLLRPWGLKALVIPYVVIVWMLQLLSGSGSNFSVVASVAPSLTIDIPVWLVGALRAPALVYFQDSVIFGAVVWISIFVLAGKRSLLAVGSVIVPQFLAMAVWPDHWGTSAGMFGFCGIILFMANENAVFKTDDRRMLILIILLSGLIEGAALRLFAVTPLYALSAPAMLMVWLIDLARETNTSADLAAKSSPPKSIKW